MQAPWVAITLFLPPSSGGPVRVLVQEPPGWHPTPRSQLTLDASTATVVKWEPFDGNNLGRKLRLWGRVLHTGEAGRVPGQVVVGLASAGGGVLVWTGVAMALHRFKAWRRRGARADSSAPQPASYQYRINGGYGGVDNQNV
jgi:uncharacterized iron-regulated membrane protein